MASMAARAGAIGFLFFLVKGMVWLGILAVATLAAARP